MNSPNKPRLRMWARALKSGQYQQGNRHMRRNGRYCCLGVAMDLAIANGCQVDGWINWGETSAMPQSVCDWYGLDWGGNGGNASVAGPDGGRGRSLSDLNDSNVPFDSIADRIIHTFGLDIDQEA